MIKPCGYESFAKLYNKTKGNNPCEFVLHNPETRLFNYNSFALPPSLFNFPNIDTRYAKLYAFNLLQPNGDLNPDAWASMKNALLRPHRDAVRNQARTDSRRAERELKKRRLDEAQSMDLGLSSSTAGQSSNKKNRSRRGKSSSSANEDDHEMNLDPLWPNSRLRKYTIAWPRRWSLTKKKKGLISFVSLLYLS